MKMSSLSAWLAGLGVLIAVHVGWYVFLNLERFSEFMMLTTWLSPLAAAFIASYFGPSRKILLGASMSIPAAVLAVLFNFAYQLLGEPVDFPGPNGGVILFFVTLAYASALSIVGAYLGYACTKGSDTKI